jgi:hypothetical protein
LAGIFALYAVWRFTTDSPNRYSGIIDSFKYGSTGGERTSGIPYGVWQTLPVLFPEYLPGKGYESLGFLYEKDASGKRKDLPIGVSRRRLRGVDVVFFNCAICHVGSVRATPDSEPRYIAGMPSNTVNLRGFFEFLFDAAADGRFTPKRILLAMDAAGYREDPINRLILRFYAIHAIRDALLDRRQRLAFITEEPEFGPGRIDTFSPAKALLNFADMRNAPPAERIGTADFPSIWNQKPRQGMQLHWDGNNTSVEERNRSAAFGTGATPPTLDRTYIKQIERWLETAEPPAYPFGIREDLAAKGAPLYARYCADCHGRNGKDFSGTRVGKVTPIEHIRTDRYRMDSYTYDLAVNQNWLYAGYGDERFSHFRKTFGYANMPLDGVWTRGPYLHNGSVPTLRDLLNSASERPNVFYRGDDVYDPRGVGFVSNVAERGNRKFFRFDTAVPGNGNMGHDGPEYGTHLAAEEKDAIVEYMKKF